MHLFVGSSNKAKLDAVRYATTHQWPDAQIQGFDVSSGVSSQPMTDEETVTGATNRAQAALEKGLSEQYSVDPSQCLGIGLEGGVVKVGNELWSTVWVVVVDPEGRVFSANGARMKLPDRIAQPILAGEEMGPLMERLMGQDNIRQNQGMLGVVTQNYVTRTEEYGGIAKLAIGLWYGRDWDANITSA